VKSIKSVANASDHKHHRGDARPRAASAGADHTRVGWQFD